MPPFNMVLRLVVLVAALAVVGCAEPDDPAAPAADPSARLLIIDLHGFIGCGVDADLIRQALAERLADISDPIDAVVFTFDSGGGMLNRVGPLSDLIYERTGQRFRCIGWIERAESAAALVALNIPELWMSSDGVIGGALGMEPGPDGNWVALDPDQQRAVRYVAAACAARGGHDRELAIALTMPEPAEHADGPTPAVLTSDEAERLGLTSTARALDEALDAAFGAGRWAVDRDASSRISGAIVQTEALRERVVELQRRCDIALEAAERGEEHALETAGAYLDEVVAISVREDPEHERVAVFMGLFDWVASTIERMHAVSGDGTG